MTSKIGVFFNCPDDLYQRMREHLGKKKGGIRKGDIGQFMIEAIELCLERDRWD